MKKIIAITAMVAAAAGIAFAAEASVTARGSGSLLNFSTKEGEKVKMFTIDNTNNDHYEWDQAGLKFDFSGEKAGGSFRIDGHDHWIEAMTAWCKPIDQLKITIGDLNVATNAETIDWSKLYNVDTVGFGLSLAPIDGFTLDLNFGKDGYGSWLEKNQVARILAKASYGADFGTVSAVFGYKGETITEGKAATTKKYVGTGDTKRYLSDDEVSLLTALGETISSETISATDDVKNKDSELVIGGGFSGNAGPVSFFADVAATLAPQADDKLSSVGFDAFATFSQDALTAKAYVKAAINPNLKDEAKTDVAFKVRADYSLGAITPYLVIKSDDVIVKDGNIGLVVKPGFTTSVDECAIDVAVETTIKSDSDTNFKVAVPVSFKVKF